MIKYPIWKQETELLPTLPNCTANIIKEGRNTQGRQTIRVQCAVCLNTVEDVMILALLQMNHGNDDRRGFPGPVLPYKRCRECRQSYRKLGLAS